MRAALRLRHYSRRTEEAYVGWVRRLVIQQGLRHPRELRRAEVTAFLSHLASERRVSASTQNQALSALLFLYQDVLGRELEWLDDVVRAKAPRRLPVVLARDEVRSLVASLEGTPRLVATLLYGSGTRLLEALPLRVKDLDLARREWCWQSVFPATRATTFIERLVRSAATTCMRPSCSVRCGSL